MSEYTSTWYPGIVEGLRRRGLWTDRKHMFCNSTVNVPQRILDEREKEIRGENKNSS